MQINSPEEMLRAVDLLMIQMSKQQRKQFLMWIKRKRNEYDFNFPNGKTLEVVNEEASTAAAPAILVPNAPDGIIPVGRTDSPTAPTSGS